MEVLLNCWKQKTNKQMLSRGYRSDDLVQFCCRNGRSHVAGRALCLRRMPMDLLVGRLDIDRRFQNWAKEIWPSLKIFDTSMIFNKFLYSVLLYVPPKRHICHDYIPFFMALADAELVWDWQHPQKAWLEIRNTDFLVEVRFFVIVFKDQSHITCNARCQRDVLQMLLHISVVQTG